jgi:hypothetical protein
MALPHPPLVVCLLVLISCLLSGGVLAGSRRRYLTASLDELRGYNGHQVHSPPLTSPGMGNMGSPELFRKHNVWIIRSIDLWSACDISPFFIK